MPSIYATHVENYGRRWHRPWLGLLFGLVACWALAWLMYVEPEEPQVVCDYKPGCRLRAAVEMNGLVWTADLEAALECAAARERRVLVAFHGLVDANARFNEVRVFPQPPVRAAMKRYVLVMLHIDAVPERFYVRPPGQQVRRDDAEAFADFEQVTFDTVTEPLYAVLEPAGAGRFRIIGYYDEGKINDATQFVDFLKSPQWWPRDRDGRWQQAMGKLRGFMGIK